MTYSILSLAISIISFALHPYQEQEMTPLEDILKWLPEGAYIRIDHVDYARLAELDLTERMRTFITQEKVRMPNYGSLGGSAVLPSQFSEDVLSYTIADKAKIAISPDGGDFADAKELKKKGKSNTPHSSSGLRKSTLILDDPGAERRMTVQNRGEWLRIFIYADAGQRIAVAVEAGELEPIDLGAAGQAALQPVYGYRNSRQEQQEYSSFMALTPTGELLVAESPEMVRRMLTAGFGAVLSMRDQREYDDLFRHLPEFGFYFRYKTYLPQLRAMFAFDRNRESDKIDVDRIEEKIEEGQQWRIDTIVVADNAVITRCVECYGSSSAAEAQLASLKQRPSARQSCLNSIRAQKSERSKKMMEDFLMHVPMTFEMDDIERQKTRYKIDGTVLICDYMIDEEHLDNYDLVNEQLKEYGNRMRTKIEKNKTEAKRK